MSDIINLNSRKVDKLYSFSSNKSCYKTPTNWRYMRNSCTVHKIAEYRSEASEQQVEQPKLNAYGKEPCVIPLPEIEIADDRLEYLDSLIADIKQYEESYTDDLLNDDSCVYADALDYLWSEDDTDDIYNNMYSNMTDSVKEIIDKLGSDDLFGDNKYDILKLLVDSSDKVCCNICLQTNELYGMIIGEVEIGLPEDIQEQLKQLNDDEIDYVDKAICLHDRRYTYYPLNYERWILVVNFDKLLDNYMEARAQLTG